MGGCLRKKRAKEEQEGVVLASERRSHRSKWAARPSPPQPADGVRPKSAASARSAPSPSAAPPPPKPASGLLASASSPLASPPADADEKSDVSKSPDSGDAADGEEKDTKGGKESSASAPPDLSASPNEEKPTPLPVKPNESAPSPSSETNETPKSERIVAAEPPKAALKVETKEEPPAPPRLMGTKPSPIITPLSSRSMEMEPLPEDSDDESFLQDFSKLKQKVVLATPPTKDPSPDAVPGPKQKKTGEEKEAPPRTKDKGDRDDGKSAESSDENVEDKVKAHKKKRKSKSVSPKKSKENAPKKTGEKRKTKGSHKKKSRSVENKGSPVKDSTKKHKKKHRESKKSKSERSVKSERSEKTEKSDKTDKSEKTEKSENTSPKMSTASKTLAEQPSTKMDDKSIKPKASKVNPKTKEKKPIKDVKGNLDKMTHDKKKNSADKHKSKDHKSKEHKLKEHKSKDNKSKDNKSKEHKSKEHKSKDHKSKTTKNKSFTKEKESPSNSQKAHN